MEQAIQCLRCYKSIPIRPEMVGQTILCPSCLERVYVSEGRAPSKGAGSADWADPSPLSDRRGAQQKRVEAPVQSPPVALLAGLGVGAALLLLVAGVVVWGLKPGARDEDTQVATSPPPPPTTPKDDEPAKPAEAKLPKSAEAPLQPALKAPPTPQVAVNPAPNESARPLSPNVLPKASTPSSLPYQPAAPGATPAWAEIWRLPAVTSTETAVLTSLDDASPTWHIAVKSPVAGLRTMPSLIVEPDGEPGAWALKYMSNPQAPAEKQVLAQLRRQGPSLLFAWAVPPPDPSFVGQVGSSLLEVSAGGMRRVGQLREPLRAEPLALDLAADEQVVESQIEAPPRMDSLRLEVFELSGFTSEAKLRAGMKSAFPPGPPSPGPLLRTPQSFGPQPLVIEFAEIPGLEIRVRFLKAEATGKLVFSIEPVFRDLQGELNLRAGTRLLDNLEKEVKPSLLKSQRELKPDEKSLSNYQEKEKDLQESEPPKNDFKRRTGWERALREAQAGISQYQSRVNGHTQIIKTAQARLDAVTKVRSFLKASTDKPALIHYVVFSECGPTDLLLVDGRGQPSPTVP